MEYFLNPFNLICLYSFNSIRQNIHSIPGIGPTYGIRKIRAWEVERFMCMFFRHYKQCVQYKQVMNDKISEAAGFLRQASDMLPSVDSSSTMPHDHSITESVTRARNMMDRSRQGGTFRRLGANKRLRSQIPCGGTKGK